MDKPRVFMDRPTSKWVVTDGGGVKNLMADHSLTKLRTVGDLDIYEVRLPDGSAHKFTYSGAQKAVDPSKEAFARSLATSIRRAQRTSDYRAQHG